MVYELKDLQLLFCVDIECSNKILKALIDLYKSTLYSYNTSIKSYGVYLKPVHIVVKKSSHDTKVYHYYGKYWYKVLYSEGKLKWIYIGKEKPFPQLPDPPLNPLITVKVLARDETTSCIYLEKNSLTEKVLRYIDEAVIRTNCVKLRK